jgi:hypothetical protein
MQMELIQRKHFYIILLNLLQKNLLYSVDFNHKTIA